MTASIIAVPVYLFFQMCVAWLIAKRLKNPSVVDVFWGIGLMVAGFIYLWPITRNLRLFITVSLLVIWALRLSVYLFFTRIWRRQQDPRYDDYAQNYFVMFQIQGFFCWIISLVFLTTAYSLLDSVTWLDYIAFTVIILGIIGESIADYQLYQLRSRQPDAVCQTGWWRYSRHPNTFFDWLTWVGFFIIGSQSHYGWLAIISPLCLYWIMNFITNPMTEKHSLSVKGDAYREYQLKTPIFFPRP